MFWTVTIAILLLLAVVNGIASFVVKPTPLPEKTRYGSSNDGPFPLKEALGAASVILSVLFIVISLLVCVSTVSARSVGVGTAFGRYTQTYDSGITFKAPWVSIEEFSTQIQTAELKVPVSYAGGGGGEIIVKVRYTVNPASVKDLWAKYKTFDRVKSELVDASVRDSVSTVAGGYSPTEARDGTNRRAIAGKVQKDLDSVVQDDGIKLDSVSVTGVALNDQSQNSIDANVKAAADVEKAKTEQQRAKIDADTAKLRERNGALTGPALQRYCLEVTNSWDVKKNGPLPATWNCLATGLADVVVSAK